MSKWQPIETAPKDGSTILGWADQWMGFHLIHWDESEGMWCEGSWLFTNPPSDWMPLPAPPITNPADSLPPPKKS